MLMGQSPRCSKHHHCAVCPTPASKSLNVGGGGQVEGRWGAGGEQVEGRWKAGGGQVERWLNSSEHWPLFQRTQVQFSVTMR